jgi:hypothetical protein
MALSWAAGCGAERTAGTESKGSSTNAKGAAAWFEAEWFKEPQMQQGMIAAAVAALLLVNMYTGDGAQEVSFQQFKIQLLEGGMVERIEVANTKTAKVCSITAYHDARGRMLRAVILRSTNERRAETPRPSRRYCSTQCTDIPLEHRPGVRAPLHRCGGYRRQ